MPILLADADNEQRVRPHQLLLANPVAVSGRVRGGHAVAAALQARHPAPHQGQHPGPISLPSRHWLPRHHPRHLPTKRHGDRSSYSAVRSPDLLSLCQVEDKTGKLPYGFRVYSKVLPKTLFLYLRGLC